MLLLTQTHEKRITKIVRETRVAVIEAYFARRNAPLADIAQDFIDISERYGLDWRLLPAISIIESSGGLRIPNDSYNPYGWGCSSTGACLRFHGWRSATEAVAAGLSNGRAYERWRQAKGNYGLLADRYNGGDTIAWLRHLESQIEALGGLEKEAYRAKNPLRGLSKEVSRIGAEHIGCWGGSNVSDVSGVRKESY